jgi:arylsulfatase A-like enzyme
VGKWHLSGTYDRSDEWKAEHYPDMHGFDVNIAGCEAGMPHHGYFAPWHLKNIEEGPDGEYLADRLTEEAIALIKDRDTEIPFFLNLWYYLVHVPVEAKAEYIEYFKKKKTEMGLDDVKEFEEGDYFPCEHKKDKRIIRRLVQSDPIYAAMVKSLDENVGKLINALKEEGIYDETIIFFTSDNGGLSSAEGSPTCNLPLNEGKGWMYEGGTREPFIVKWKDCIAPGSRIDTPISSPDIYPTICEMTGTVVGKEVSGISLSELLQGKSKGALNERPIFWHYPHYANQGGTPGSSVRKGRYKVIEFYETGSYELYDLVEDPGEKNNLIEKIPDVANELIMELIEWKDSVNALIPKRNKDFIPWRQCHSELI